MFEKPSHKSSLKTSLTEQSKKDSEMEKKLFHGIKVYKRGCSQRANRLQWYMLSDRHSFEILVPSCYLSSYEVSLPRINTRLSLGEIEISIENSSSSSRHIYN